MLKSKFVMKNCTLKCWLYLRLFLWRTLKKIFDYNFGDENLFRLIFETQIHIQIHVRYFKSLPIATYYLTTIHIKNLYLYSKTYNMGLKWNLYLKSLSLRGLVNPSTPLFGNINLTETMTNLIVARKFNHKRLQESLSAP